MSEIERERLELADKIGLSIERVSGTVFWQAQLTGLEWGVILAALRRDQPKPDADTAGREAGAADMRERCAVKCEEIRHLRLAVYYEAEEDGRSGEAATALGAAGCADLIAAAIRALPLRPETDPASETDGGDRG